MNPQIPRHLQSQYSIILNGTPLPIIVRKHRNARRIVVRYQPAHHQLTLTLPPKVAIAQGLHFIEKKRLWIEQAVKKKPPNIPFVHGQEIPVLGKKITLVHVGGRGTSVLVDNQLQVHGEEEFMARRVRDWIKLRAKEEILKLVEEKSRRLGKRPGKVTLRDTVSLWGSCNKKGDMSFCWRLAFAPYAMLDYVVAHEVAHLKLLNHSKAFWQVVAELCPEYETPRRWLTKHGALLYHYG